MPYLFGEILSCLLVTLLLGWAGGWLWRNWSSRQELQRLQSVFDGRLERVQRSVESARSELMSASGLAQSADQGCRHVQELVQALLKQLRNAVEGLRADFAGQEHYRQMLDLRGEENAGLVRRLREAEVRLEESAARIADKDQHAALLRARVAELDALAAQLADRDARLLELEARTKAIEEESTHRAQRCAELEQELCRLQPLTGRLAEREQHTASLEHRLAEMEGMRRRLAEHAEEVSHLRASMAAAQAGLTQRDQDVAAARLRQVETEQQLQERQERVRCLEEQLAGAETRIAVMESELAGLRERAGDSERASEDTREHAANVERQLTESFEMARQLQQRVQALEPLGVELAERDQHVQALTGRLGELAALLAERECAHAQAVERLQEIEPLRMQLERRQQDADELAGALGDAGQQLSSRDQFIRGLQERALELESELIRRSQEWVQREEAAGSLGARVLQLERELTRRDNYIRNLEQRSTEQDTELVRLRDALERLQPAAAGLDQEQARRARLDQQIRDRERDIASLEEQVGRLDRELASREEDLRWQRRDSRAWQTGLRPNGESAAGSVPESFPPPEAAADRRNRELRQRVAELEEALQANDGAAAERDQLRDALRESDREMTLLRERVSVLVPRLAEQDRRLREWTRRFEAMVQQKDELIDSLRRQLAELRHVSAEDAARRARELLAVQRIEFEPGSADLEPASHPVLDQIASLLLQEPGIAIEIGGRSEDSGDFRTNLELSQRRAAEVRRQLIARGVAPYRILGVGYGATRATEEEAGRSIEFFVLPQAPWEQAVTNSRVF
jgi:outer membrane protein OmpA-like peptidoglycan-associated protein